MGQLLFFPFYGCRNGVPNHSGVCLELWFSRISTRVNVGIDSTVVSFTIFDVLTKLFYYLSLDFSLAFPLLSPKANLETSLWLPILMPGSPIPRLYTLESWTSYFHCCWSPCAACLLSLPSPSFHQTLIITPRLLCWPPANHCICSLCSLCSFFGGWRSSGYTSLPIYVGLFFGAPSTPGNPANISNMPLCSSLLLLPAT